MSNSKLDDMIAKRNKLQEQLDLMQQKKDQAEARLQQAKTKQKMFDRKARNHLMYIWSGDVEKIFKKHFGKNLFVLDEQESMNYILKLLDQSFATIKKKKDEKKDK